MFVIRGAPASGASSQLTGGHPLSVSSRDLPFVRVCVLIRPRRTRVAVDCSWRRVGSATLARELLGVKGDGKPAATGKALYVPELLKVKYTFPLL